MPFEEVEGASITLPVSQTAADRPLILMDPHPRPIKLIFSDEDRDRLNALGRVLWYEGARAPDEYIDAHLSEAVALIGQSPMPLERLGRASKLRAIFNVEGNFLQNIDYQECHRRNIHVLACSRAFSPAVAELALGLALSAARGIVANDAAFRRGEEKYSAASNTDSRLLRGRTMGLLGCGNVARMLLPLIRPLGGKILVHDPWLHENMLQDMGLQPVDLHTLVKQSDTLFVLSAATPENGQQLGAKQFDQMRPGAIVVLVGRAEVVDVDALLDAADSGRIRAAIDVFPEEPVPPDDRVRRTANVILSGHRAGGLPETYHRVGRMVVDDLEMILRGLPPGQLQPAVLETVCRQRGKPITAAVMKK
ncbi:MAG: NAD(P)-dependent oxidoreductase [Planctomycetota bacterium]|nr:NAD(P)-dependent oxidoreductase [Planctomycetota bacterium]